MAREQGYDGEIEKKNTLRIRYRTKNDKSPPFCTFTGAVVKNINVVYGGHALSFISVRSSYLIVTLLLLTFAGT